MKLCNSYNITTSNTCFEGSGSCIKLIITNRKNCFKNATLFETGRSKHHYLIPLILKTKYGGTQNQSPIATIKICNEKTLSKTLLNTLSKQPCPKKEEKWEEIIDYFRIAIMRRLRLKIRASRSKTIIDISICKKQREVAVLLNHQTKTK